MHCQYGFYDEYKKVLLWYCVGLKFYEGGTIVPGWGLYHPGKMLSIYNEDFDLISSSCVRLDLRIAAI
jgi:hypothetical protein